MHDAAPAVRRRANGKETRQRLLAVAVSIWSDQGLAGVTISSVAKHAGTTRRTVYHHFPDREALVAAATAQLDEQVGKLARGDVGSFPDPYGLIAGLAADSLDMVRGHVVGMLSRNAYENPLVQDLIRHYRSPEGGRTLRPGVDPDHAAVITLSMWLAATMAVSLGRTPEQQRAQVRAFGHSFGRFMREGLFIDGTPERPLP